MLNSPFRAYLRKMMPDWIDYDRLQLLLACVAVLAFLLAVVGLALARRPAVKVFAVLVFGAVAVGAAWQLRTIEDTRRTDCAKVEMFGARVAVPACPEPPA
jgi:hypothetical protein